MTLNKPDRLVLDFRNTEPGAQPQRTRVNRGGIETVRIGEDGGSPPTTRVVLDLLQPQEFRLVQNQNRITLVPGSIQSPRTEPARPEATSADPPKEASPESKSGNIPNPTPAVVAVSENGSKKEPNSSEPLRPATTSADHELTRSGPDPTYSPHSEPLVAESKSEKNAVDAESAAFSATPEQPAAALLDSLPLHAFSLSSLLEAPIAIAVGAPAPEDSQFDLKEHNQTMNAMLAYSETLPAMRESSSTASDAVLPSSASSGMEVTTSPQARGRDDRKFAPPAGTADRDFVIGPGDVLGINVWKEPDISRVIPVRSDGKISLPLVGELQASGQTPRALEAEISRGLRAYISEPTVAVIVQEIRSRQYNILGQVTKPGSYMLLNSATVLDAIAVAGGFRDFAKKKSIYVLRRDSTGKESRLPFNYTKVIKGGNLEQNVVLRPGDTIVVP
jgi:polysaccharide export outer membrane protein